MSKHNKNTALTKLLQKGTGKSDENKKVSLSKLHTKDEGELLKFVMIVKPGYVKGILEGKGFSMQTKEDFASLPKIMKLGLDKKGLENDKGEIVVFDLRKILEDAEMPAEEIKESGIIFIR